MPKMVGHWGAHCPRWAAVALEGAWLMPRTRRRVDVFGMLDADSLSSVLASLDVPSLRQIKASGRRLCAAGRAILLGPHFAQRRALAVRQAEITHPAKPRGASHAWLAVMPLNTLAMMVRRRGGAVMRDTQLTPLEFPIVRWLMGRGPDGARTPEELLGLQDWDAGLPTAMCCVFDGWFERSRIELNGHYTDAPALRMRFESTFRMLSLWDDENIKAKSRRVLEELDGRYRVLDGLFNFDGATLLNLNAGEEPPFEQGLDFLQSRLLTHACLVVHVLQAAIRCFSLILDRILPCFIDVRSGDGGRVTVDVVRLEYIDLLDAALDVGDVLHYIYLEMSPSMVGRVLRAWADNTRAVEPQEYVDALVDFAFERYATEPAETVELLCGFKERQTDTSGYATNPPSLVACLDDGDKGRMAHKLSSDLYKASDLLTAESKVRREEVARERGHLTWRPWRTTPPLLYVPSEVGSEEDDESDGE